MDVDGVIGYQAQTVAPPYSAPRAAAVLPSMKILSLAASQRRNWYSMGPSR